MDKKPEKSDIDISCLGEDFYLALLNQFLEYMENKEKQSELQKS